MDLKVWKLRERVDAQQVSVVWCSTVDQQSDLNTKALPTRQFRYLRDNLNGYGLNGRRSDCNHREDRERIGSRYRLVLGGRPRAYTTDTQINYFLSAVYGS